jgi:uncharacterized protein YjeT (DUF2065 family)
MSDLLDGAGLVFVNEGLIWALSPRFGQQLMKLAAMTPDQRLRTGGAVAVGFGVFLIWMIRG